MRVFIYGWIIASSLLVAKFDIDSRRESWCDSSVGSRIFKDFNYEGSSGLEFVVGEHDAHSRRDFYVQRASG